MIWKFRSKKGRRQDNCPPLSEVCQRPKQSLTCYSDQVWSYAVKTILLQGKTILQCDTRGQMKIFRKTPNRWPRVSTTSVSSESWRKKKGRRQRKSIDDSAVNEWLLTFLLSFVLLGLFLLFGYRLRHFPATWKKAVKEESCWQWDANREHHKYNMDLMRHNNLQLGMRKGCVWLVANAGPKCLWYDKPVLQ